ncbi:MAG: DUF4433 domain-containing protein [Chloroflexi bacterium]|nr:DUF4433 domain-containing protein [Chloroflexota bacterium]
MTKPVPARPKIYHIVHVDRLPSIVANECLWSDLEISRHRVSGTTIGMNNIKYRRLHVLTLNSHPGLYVGNCVPFYFCPRSVMLYVIHMADHPELEYRDGQAPIIHLEADVHEVVAWAEQNSQRWAFTTSNAGSRFFDDYSDLADLDRVDWNAVKAHYWSECRESKQAEFLIERLFPWELVSRIGVRSQHIQNLVQKAIGKPRHHPSVEIMPHWYY